MCGNRCFGWYASGEIPGTELCQAATPTTGCFLGGFSMKMICSSVEKTQHGVSAKNRLRGLWPDALSGGGERVCRFKNVLRA